MEKVFDKVGDKVGEEKSDHQRPSGRFGRDHRRVPKGMTIAKSARARGVGSGTTTNWAFWSAAVLPMNLKMRHLMINDLCILRVLGFNARRSVRGNLCRSP